jgi:hypothetical protein
MWPADYRLSVIREVPGARLLLEHIAALVGLRSFLADTGKPMEVPTVSPETASKLRVHFQSTALAYQLPCQMHTGNSFQEAGAYYVGDIYRPIFLTCPGVYCLAP